MCPESSQENGAADSGCGRRFKIEYHPPLLGCSDVCSAEIFARTSMMSAAGTQMKTEMSVVQAYTAVLFRFLMSPMALHRQTSKARGTHRNERRNRRNYITPGLSGKLRWQMFMPHHTEAGLVSSPGFMIRQHHKTTTRFKCTCC